MSHQGSLSVRLSPLSNEIRSVNFELAENNLMKKEAYPASDHTRRIVFEADLIITM